jgi:4-hydroxybenzoate polyprenyltransferase
MSSATYIVNDIVDRDIDKFHPVKCKRPITAGQIPVPAAWIYASILAISSLCIACAARGSLILALLAYLVLTISYSLVLKHLVIIDVLAIAVGFLLRATAGAIAVRVPVSGWFLVCTGFGAVFLALQKRRRELQIVQDAAESHRKTLKVYSVQLLDRLEAITLPTLLTSYCFYSFMSFHGQWMMLSVPFVVYGLMRYQQLSCAADGQTDAPENIFARDRPIQLTIVLWLITSALVVYGFVQNYAHILMRIADSLGH